MPRLSFGTELTTSCSKLRQELKARGRRLADRDASLAGWCLWKSGAVLTEQAVQEVKSAEQPAMTVAAPTAVGTPAAAPAAAGQEATGSGSPKAAEADVANVEGWRKAQAPAATAAPAPATVLTEQAAQEVKSAEQPATTVAASTAEATPAAAPAADQEASPKAAAEAKEALRACLNG